MAGGIPPYIYADIGGADRWIWFVSDQKSETEKTQTVLTAR